MWQNQWFCRCLFVFILFCCKQESSAPVCTLCSVYLVRFSWSNMFLCSTHTILLSSIFYCVSRFILLHLFLPLHSHNSHHFHQSVRRVTSLAFVGCADAVVLRWRVAPRFIRFLQIDSWMSGSRSQEFAFVLSAPTNSCTMTSSIYVTAQHFAWELYRLYPHAMYNVYYTVLGFLKATLIAEVKFIMFSLLHSKLSRAFLFCKPACLFFICLHWRHELICGPDNKSMFTCSSHEGGYYSVRFSTHHPLFLLGQPKVLVLSDVNRSPTNPSSLWSRDCNANAHCLISRINMRAFPAAHLPHHAHAH